MATRIFVSTLVALSLSSALSFADAGKTGRVFFISPKDKSTVGKSVTVKMGVEGRAVCPAGPETADKTCGHHHIIIDKGFIPEGQVVPKDDSHLHYGKGETEATITLTPGKHKLTLQFADFAHRSYGEKLSQTIEVDVK